ncbi:MAG: hypothetical protein ACMUHM_07160 [Thermoplasmatota archaeon]
MDIDEVRYITETKLTIRGTRRRTTVPKRIIDHFELRNGDRIRWCLCKDGGVMVLKAQGAA